MVSIASFGDFILVTTEAYLRGQKEVIRDFVENCYIFGEMLYASGMSDALKGGAKISDALTLEDPGTARFFGSDSDTFVWKNPQTFQGWSVEWRKAITHYSWARDEKALQGVEDMTRSARFKVFKRVLDNKIAGAYQSLYNLSEAALWAIPDPDKMETTDEGVPNSLPVFMNEFDNSLFQAPGLTAYTAIEGISPVTYPRWRNGFAKYTSAGTAWVPRHTLNGTQKNFMDALTTAHRITGYKPMRGAREGVFTGTTDQKRKIICSGDTYDAYSNLTRTDQDQYRYGPADGGVANPMNKGVEVMYASALDDQTLYPDDNRAAAPSNLISDARTFPSGHVGGYAGGSVFSGPRAYLVDCEYTRIVFHVTDMIVQHEITHHHNQPLTYVRPITAKYNVVQRSMQRNAIIGPANTAA